MHRPYPTPPNTVDTRFEADGAGTMDAMIATGMAHGMETRCARLGGRAGLAP